MKKNNFRAFIIYSILILVVIGTVVFLLNNTGSKKEMSYKEVLQLNSDFHFSIYELANSPLRLEIVRMLWLRIGPTLRYMYPILHKGRADHRRHEDIIDAATRRDPKGLRDALLADIETGRIALRQYIRDHSTKPSSRRAASAAR